MSGSLSIEDFGLQLLLTLDLDPLYVGLDRAKLPRNQLYRWLFAYWCFYHVGSASLVSELKDAEYWKVMRLAAVNSEPPRVLFGGDSTLSIVKRWPRGAERRHFRSKRCVDAIDWFAYHYPRPEAIVESLGAGKLGVCDSVMERVRSWPMFGPWIAFKAVDMLERVAHWDLMIPKDVVLMYHEPRSSLLELCAARGVSPDECFSSLVSFFHSWTAPPRNDRLCGPAEVETILCKYKSYRKGHYWVGKDVREQREALNGWGSTAVRLLAVYPPEVGNASEHTRDQRVREVHRRSTFPEL